MNIEEAEANIGAEVVLVGPFHVKDVEKIIIHTVGGSTVMLNFYNKGERVGSACILPGYIALKDK